MNKKDKIRVEDVMLDQLGTLRKLYKIVFRNNLLLNAILFIEGILLVIAVFFYNFTTK